MSSPKAEAAEEARIAHIALWLDDQTKRAVEGRLASRGLVTQFIARRTELMECLPTCQWLLCGRPPRIDWSAATRLRLLMVPGTGIDPLFPAVGLAETVRIACTRGGQADAVRDHAIGLLLALARGIPRLLEAQATKTWSPAPAPSLTGKALAVVGFGEVGSRVADTGRALGLRVRAVCRTPRTIADVDPVVTADRLGDALDGADFVVVCAPLTTATRHLLDESALQRLPLHAVVVDVSRGGVLDARALERALRTGHLAGAALDVFEDEPLPPEDTLWTCPGLIVTPHVGGYTPDFIEHGVEAFLDNIERIRQGEAPNGEVLREREY